MRPVLVKKNSSTACVRGGRLSKATFNRFCDFEESTSIALLEVESVYENEGLSGKKWISRLDPTFRGSGPLFL